MKPVAFQPMQVSVFMIMMLLKNHGTVFDIHIKITDGNEPVDDHITHLRKHPQCVKNESFDENKQSGPPFPAQQVWHSAYHASIKDTSVEVTSGKLSDIVDELKEALERQPATKDKEEKKEIGRASCRERV